MTGSGTQQDPYIIEDVNDLQAMENDLDAYYELGGNIDASATSGWNEVMDDDGLYIWFDSGGDSWKHVYGANWCCQTFTPTEDIKVTKLGLFGYRNGSPGICYAYLYATDGDGKPTGAALATGSVSANGWSSSVPAGRKITLSSPINIASGTKYAMVIACPSGSSLNYIRWRHSSGGGYSGGQDGASNDSGSTWSMNTDSDLLFYVYGEYGTGVFAGFEPIGSVLYPGPVTNAFTGSLDGKGYSVINLTINRPTKDYVGLFAVMEYPAIIQNLTLANVNITGRDYVGALAGHIGRVGLTALGATTISVCASSGVIFGRECAGGIVGTSRHIDMDDSHSSVDVTGVAGAYELGGLFGCLSYNIEVDNCYATGAVSGTQETGGFAGYIGNAPDTIGHVNDCYAEGAVTGDENSGGFVGTVGVNPGMEINRCRARGSVAATGDNSGGFAGFIGGNIVVSQCSAEGDINVAPGATWDAGGFAGHLHTGEFTDCYARGNVTAPSVTEVGGFVGWLWNGATLNNSYSTGTPTGLGSVGGFCGFKDGGIIGNCFWDTETSSQATSDGGTGKTTSEMKNKATFTDVGWDFTTIWAICSEINSGYPCLMAVTPGCTGGIIPTVTTDPATSIEVTGATLHGTLTDDGGQASDCYFLWGLETAYGHETPWQSGRHTGVAFVQPITDLKADTVYHFRAFARNSAGLASGSDITFKTLKETTEIPHSMVDPSLKLLLEEET